MELKQTIIDELSLITRDGMQELIKFLGTTDFFTAPASTFYHRAYPGGLARHSWEVYVLLRRRAVFFDLFDRINVDSLVLAALLHDICKIHLYIRNGAKYNLNFTSLREGHGRRSLALLERYISLTELEKKMIFYHMGPYGAYESGCKGSEYTLSEYIQACNSEPFISLLHECDNQEAKWME